MGETWSDFWSGSAGRSVQRLTIRELADYAGGLARKSLPRQALPGTWFRLRFFSATCSWRAWSFDNIAELLGSQKLWQRVPKVLSPEQVNRLFECRGKAIHIWRRDRALLELLYATGCRASELSHLKLRDLHLDEGYCICRGKGDKERMVPLGGRAIEALKAYLEQERGKLAGKRGRGGGVGSFELSWPAPAEGADLGIGQAICAAGGHAGGNRPAHAAALFCHAHAGWWRRFAAGAGDAGARQHSDDADLRPRRCDAAEGGAQGVPSAGVKSSLPPVYSPANPRLDHNQNPRCIHRGLNNYGRLNSAFRTPSY